MGPLEVLHDSEKVLLVLALGVGYALGYSYEELFFLVGCKLYQVFEGILVRRLRRHRYRLTDVV